MYSRGRLSEKRITQSVSFRRAKIKKNIYIVMKYLLDYFFLFAYFFKPLLEATHAQARSI